jgi:YjgF/chorismate_mutase-like, putative endoribonuclease
MPDYEGRARELGLEIPDYSVTPYYGPSYGSMKAHHQVGSTLFLSGHIPEKPNGTILHPGRLGADVTVEQGYEAARLTALNCLAGIRLALGSLDRVKGLVRSLNFVVCTPSSTTCTWSRAAPPICSATCSGRRRGSADGRRSAS